MSEAAYRPSTRRIAMTIAMVMTIVYLTYRGLFTLNLSSPYAIAASTVLYVAEFYGGFLMFLFFFQIWDLHSPEPVPSTPGRTVDVMIPTYNEDPTLLTGTISAALKIAYPHRTLVLDDGKRPEVKALCEELGAEYVTRPTNMHAKAGNLNHALEMTDGEFVVIFDADHVAESHFIDRLVGYFTDDRLGFVQTPHAFYNFDAFQGVLNYQRGVYWEEGMLFYNVTQPGKNRWNGVTFCGSAAMFRRKALEEVGLIATQSITEDMHTGLRMHAKGWKSLFVNERLIAAIAADDVTSFNTQRLRWGEGNLGIFAFDNPITIRGLTLAQRLCYLGSMLSWTTGVQKLLIYATPIAMLITDVSPVNKMTWELGVITAFYLASIWSAVKISSNGYGRLLAIELTQMACFWVQVKSTWRAIFKRKKATFVVTSKRGRQSNSILKHLAPQISIIAASAIAITWALTRYCLFISNDLIGLIVGSALLIVNCYTAWLVIQRALRTKDRRSSWRHPVALHVNYRGVTTTGEAIQGQCVTRDINEGGVGLVTYDPLPECEQLELQIAAAGRSVTCATAIRHRCEEVRLKAARGGVTQAFVYGIEFLNPTKDQLGLIWWLGAQYAVSLHYERFRGGQFGLGPMKDRRLPVSEDELAFELPTTFYLDDERTFGGVTDAIGPGTFKAVLAEDLDCDQPIRMELATPFGTIEAWVEAQEKKTRTIAGQVVQETRFRYRRFGGESRSVLQSMLGHSDSRQLATVVRSAPQRRRTESLQPLGIVCGTTGLAASIAVGCVLYFQQEQLTLARAHAGHEMSPSQVAQLSMLANTLENEPNLSETQVLQLRKVMADLKREEEVDAIDTFFAGRKATSLDGLSLKAGSLQRLRRQEEAEPVFKGLMTKLASLESDEVRREVVLAAARNSAMLDEFPEAVKRFETLKTLGPMDEQARLEYVGVLYQVGRLDDAIKLLKAEPLSPNGWMLLGSIYSSEKAFARAAEAYAEAVQAEPDNLIALRGLADNSYWSQDLAAAAKAYRDLIRRKPGDLQVQEQLADVLLSDKHFDESLRLYSALLDGAPDQKELWDRFLMAATGSSRLDPHEQRQLETIYRNRNRYPNDKFLVALLNAVSKHGKTAESLILLEGLVKRVPHDSALRLQLADALYRMGDFKGADVHYRWLMAHAQSPSVSARQASARLRIP